MASGDRINGGNGGVRLPHLRAQHPWQFYVATAFVGAGVGLAFASMANLIVESVPQTETSVATGTNIIVRTIGGVIGTQVAV